MADLAFTGCQKEPLGPSATTPTDDHDYTPRVRAFVEMATGMGQRDGNGTMLADSAEWYIEAGLNYSHADLSIAYNDADVDSAYYTLPIADGIASEADAASAYNALSAIVSGGNVEGESHVVILDVTSRTTTDGLELTAAYVTGSGYDKALNTTYGSTDFWLWKSNSPGSSAACSTNTSSSHLGADYRIQQRINNELTALGQNVYMVSVETWTLFTYNDESNKVRAYYEYTDGGSPHGYKTYACSGSCTNCLTPSHMSYYTQGTWDVMNSIKAQYCPTKKAQQCTVTGEIQTGSPNLYFHMAQYRYGIIPK